ncbi:50S ribosomal protein L30e [Candidatus Bathyarchaeota archaeon]|nr:50S ribosomal protein L30e [Candidatus Bathyarchaeota archaeon]MBS7618178.1 50S ribosomal protein L30e [Candidatus Bathyarchaeota archaeon]
MVDVNKAIYSAVKTGKVILGSRRSLNFLKMGKAKFVIVASNIPKDLREVIDYYTKLTSIPVYTYKGTSIDLGHICGKPFPIMMMAIREPGNSNIMELVEKHEE